MEDERVSTWIEHYANEDLSIENSVWQQLASNVRDDFDLGICGRNKEAKNV